MSTDPLHRCELCGVIIAEAPADTSVDVLCPECTDHLGDAAAQVLYRCVDMLHGRHAPAARVPATTAHWLAAWLQWAATPPQEALHHPAALAVARALLTELT